MKFMKVIRPASSAEITPSTMLFSVEKSSSRLFFSTPLISARARDYYVDDRTRGFLRGDQEPARFQEFWTFQWQGGNKLMFCIRGRPA